MDTWLVQAGEHVVLNVGVGSLCPTLGIEFTKNNNKINKNNLNKYKDNKLTVNGWEKINTMQTMSLKKLEWLC